jgi:hypothetical protein
MELSPLIIGAIAVVVFMTVVVAIIYYNLNKISKETS